MTHEDQSGGFVMRGSFFRRHNTCELIGSASTVYIWAPENSRHSTLCAVMLRSVVPVHDLLNGVKTSRVTNERCIATTHTGVEAYQALATHKRNF